MLAPHGQNHPATGRKALYVNRLMTVAIQGLSESESDELLNTLFDHQEQREFIYEHVWRDNSLGSTNTALAPSAWVPHDLLTLQLQAKF